MSDLLLTTDDTAPTLSGVCKNGADPASLVGAASVTIRIRRPVSDLIDRAVDVTDAAGGAWSLAWQVGDLSDDGVYEAAVRVVYSDGRVQTFGPDTFTVQLKIS